MKSTCEMDTIFNDDLGGVLKESVGVVRIQHVEMRKMRKSMKALQKKKNSTCVKKCGDNAVVCHTYA